MSAFDKVRAVYEQLGAHDPFWAVLSQPGYRRGVVDREEFFATGQREIARQMQLVTQAGVPLDNGTALDFGCGVGRLTNALAMYFDEVVGVDVSSTMVDKANRLRRSDRVHFVTNTQENLSVFRSEQFDFVYSDITLQHIPMPAAGNYLAEFVRLLKPGGLAICLVPDGKYFRPGSLARRWDRFYRERWRPLSKRLRGKPEVQIHNIPRRHVEQILAQAGGSLLRTEVKPEFKNKRGKYKPLYYWFQKAQSANRQAA